MAYGVRLNFMQELQCAYNEFYAQINPPLEKDIEIWTEFVGNKTFSFVELYLMKLAEMLGKCEQFAELPFLDKVRCFRKQNRSLVSSLQALLAVFSISGKNLCHIGFVRNIRDRLSSNGHQRSRH